ncbi:nitroreductase family protein [Streptomyces sp. 769]|uniref:nitroreductase family protein n=1 Tax=Streptomyces sp. 769 TaxID=1262452 RepID=UPI00099C654D|nr:nitroreductase family protein [Streptomyces sp. 769]
MQMKPTPGSLVLHERNTRPISDLPEPSDVLKELQSRSRLDAEDLQAPPTVPQPALIGTLAQLGTYQDCAIAAVSAPPSQVPLETLLRQRTSVRAYNAKPVPVELLSSVVQQAVAFDRSAWPDDEAGAGLQFLVAARSVTGLPQGLYLYSADRGDFASVADLPDGEAAAELVLQLEYAHSPAIVIVCGPLAASLDRHGEHGHRLLLTRAGAATHTAWLAALDRGLVGSVFAGFLSSALKALVPVDGYRSAQLFAFSCGYPLTTEGV